MTEKGLNELTEAIIGCAFTVANALGSGFLEKVYENALAHELRNVFICGSFAFGFHSGGRVIRGT